jgi:hypothetical protein
LDGAKIGHVDDLLGGGLFVPRVGYNSNNKEIKKVLLEEFGKRHFVQKKKWAMGSCIEILVLTVQTS